MSTETKETQKDKGWEDINTEGSIYSKIVDLEMHIIYAKHIEGEVHRIRTSSFELDMNTQWNKNIEIIHVQTIYSYS